MTDAAMELPKYVSHKTVWALKIASIQSSRDLDGGGQIVPENKDYARFRVDAEYMRKHSPQAGGYYVVYDDGYKSWSPAEAFETGYTKV